MKAPSYRKYFTAAISRQFPDEATSLIRTVDQHYQVISKDVAFIETSRNPLDRRLDFSSYFLALIKTLDEKGESFENIRLICLEIVSEFVRPRSKLASFFKRLPPKLMGTWLAEKLLKKLSSRVREGAGGQGFVANIITDKTQTYGFGYGVDILECGICKLFNKHKYEKYATILCEVDKITTSLAGLEMIRSGTIANGAEKCDFRYRLKRD